MVKDSGEEARIAIRQGRREANDILKKAEKDKEITEDELKGFLHDRLAPYKRPTKIVVATDLPAAPTGKILKSKLIDTFAEQLAEPV